jgi:hypothetical protein
MNVERHGKDVESDYSGLEHCGCEPESERAAMAEVEKACDEITRAKHEIERGVEDLGHAEVSLKKAEEDLDRANHNREVRFTVDGEPFETRHPRQTPNYIIDEYSDRDPAANYLVKIKGHGKDVSYKDKGDIPITIEDCDAFQIISIGPAPVSDGRAKTGVDWFITGLKEASYRPEIVPGKPEHVAFSYQVPTGRYAGQWVNIGLIIPPDFPITAPGGVHITPRIHPNKSGGNHPTGGVHDSPFQGHLNQSWQYWSRPFSEWGKTKKTVAAYLGHLWKLWDTQ